MMRFHLWPVVLAGGIVAACATRDESARPVARPVEPPPAAPAGLVRPTANSGVFVTRMYRENCANCHGNEGQGGGAGTPSLITPDKFASKWDRPFFNAVLNGVPDRAMPAYAASMTDEEVWAMVVHIRELQKQGLRSSGTGLWADSATPHKTRVEDVVGTGKGLNTPWSLGFLPGGGMLVTNRGGKMFRVKGGALTEITGLPPTVEIGQGGLMDVAPHPTNGWIYLALNDPAPAGARGGMTKIVRGKLSGNVWTSTQTIFQPSADSYSGQGIHFGGKIAFDKKGHVFFSIGERGTRIKTWDPNATEGKIFRVNDDGSLPKDNPFAGKGPVAGAVYSLAHRNPQGLVVDLDGRIWDTEHGPRGGDELNLIRPGGNYGWPTYGYSIDYNDLPFNQPWPKKGEVIEQPVERWLPSIGASGLDVYRGKAFPKWKGNLLAGGLAGQNLDRFRIVNGKVTQHEELLQGAGRVRDVRVGPDGFVYVVLNGPDKIVRLMPAQ